MATLGQIGGESELNRAMEICLKNLFQNTSSGLHHEALGFRISLRHLLRKMGRTDVAETCMDLVYKDILDYGCSERTYLAFLLEAGRTARAQNMLIRAYSGYFRPCFDRANSRGYVRYAETALRSARETLGRIIDLHRDIASDTDWLALLREALSPRGDFLRQRELKVTDPLFSFDLGVTENFTSRLSNEAGLAEE